MLSIHDNLLHLLKRIREFEKKYHKASHAVSLLAASKGQSPQKIQEAMNAGQYCFGENYLQEALAKMKAIPHPKLEWHFIGSIQSNKTRDLAKYFAWVHTVCSHKIAKRLNEQRLAFLPPLNICLEINVSMESSKTGLTQRNEILALADYCLSLPRLRLRGLMTIPAPTLTIAEQRVEYRKLVEIKEMLLQEGVPIDSLSMGMTDDIEAAIAEGATIVRVGRGIFGGRE